VVETTPGREKGSPIDAGDPFYYLPGRELSKTDITSGKSPREG